MHCLVTGAAGFIASAVCRELLRQGHSVVAIDNFNDAYDVRMKHWRRDALARLGVTVQRVDVRDRTALEPLFPGVEVVFNLAARAGVRQSVIDPWGFIDTNTTGTCNLLELCKTHGVKKFVLASTSSLYGNTSMQAKHEELPTNRVLSHYAATKLAAEALCHSYHHLFGIDVTVCRYFTVYGPAGRPDMSLFRFVQWVSEGRPVTIFGDGSQRRDFSYVDDIARGTVAAARPLGYEVINLGCDQPWVLMDALRLIESLTRKRAQIDFQPMHAADIMASWASIDKAKRLLGWQPQTMAREGIKALVDWYDAERSWAKDLRTD